MCKRKSEYVCVYETEREKEREVVIPASLVFNREKKHLLVVTVLYATPMNHNNNNCVKWKTCVCLCVCAYIFHAWVCV